MPTTFPTKPLTRINVSPSPVNAVTFSSGTGQYILTGSQDRQIRLFNPSSSGSSSHPSSRIGRPQPQQSSSPTPPIQTFSAHGYEILDLSVSTDNSHLVSCGGDKSVFLWDVATATTLRRFSGHSSRVNAVTFAGSDSNPSSTSLESLVISGSFDRTVKFWDLRSRNERPIMTLSEARDSVSAVEVRGANVFVGSVDGRVRIYDLVAGKCECDIVVPEAGVTGVAPTVAGDAYLVSSPDSGLRLMDRVTGRLLQKFTDGEGGFVNEEYRVRGCMADGDACAISGSEDGRVVVWDVLSGEVIERVWHREREGGRTKRDVVCAVAWNQLRKRWASAGGDGSVVVWGMD